MDGLCGPPPAPQEPPKTDCRNKQTRGVTHTACPWDSREKESLARNRSFSRSTRPDSEIEANPKFRGRPASRNTRHNSGQPIAHMTHDRGRAVFRGVSLRCHARSQEENHRPKPVALAPFDHFKRLQPREGAVGGLQPTPEGTSLDDLGQMTSDSPCKSRCNSTSRRATTSEGGAPFSRLTSRRTEMGSSRARVFRPSQPAPTTTQPPNPLRKPRPRPGPPRKAPANLPAPPDRPHTPRPG